MRSRARCGRLRRLPVVIGGSAHTGGSHVPLRAPSEAPCEQRKASSPAGSGSGSRAPFCNPPGSLPPTFTGGGQASRPPLPLPSPAAATDGVCGINSGPNPRLLQQQRAPAANVNSPRMEPMSGGGGPASWGWGGVSWGRGRRNILDSGRSRMPAARKADATDRPPTGAAAPTQQQTQGGGAGHPRPHTAGRACHDRSQAHACSGASGALRRCRASPKRGSGCVGYWGAARKAALPVVDLRHRQQEH